MSNDYLKNIFNLGESSMSDACEMLNISKDSVLDCVEKVSEWYKKQPHLPINALDRRHVIGVLMWTKNSVEKTKKIIDSYYTSRTKFSEMYSNRDPNDQILLKYYEYCGIAILPILTKEFYRVVLARFTDVDYNDFDPEQGFKFLLMVVDFRTHYELCAGDIHIFDLSRLSIRNSVKFTPMLLKKMFYIIQSNYPQRTKSMHFINCPSYSMNIIKIAKLILKKKIADRIYLHESLEDLHKHVGPKYLPKEYGGDLKPISQISEITLTAMQSDEWKKWYQESEFLKSDESKRIQKLDDQLGEILGIEGSFRKLEID